MVDTGTEFEMAIEERIEAGLSWLLGTGQRVNVRARFEFTGVGLS